MRALRCAGLATVLLTPACELPTVGQGVPIGIVSFDGVDSLPLSRYATIGQFYRRATFDPSLLAEDGCHAFLLNGETWNAVFDRRVGFGPEGDLPQSPFLRAGDAVVVTSTGRVDSLPWSSGFVRPVGYLPAGADDLALTPGDSIDVAVLGESGGFPSASLGIRLAEGGGVDTATMTVGNAALTLTWTPSAQPGARVLAYFAFSSVAPPVPTSSANTLLICSLADDGSAVVPAEELTQWRAAWAHTVSLRAARARFARRDLPGAAEFFLVTTAPMAIQ